MGRVTLANGLEAQHLRALITGIAGFVGRHLAERLLADGDVEVWGIVRPGQGTASQIGNGSSRLLEADLTSFRLVRHAVEAAQPDWVFHLAAQSSVALAWREPERTLVDNTVMQLNVLRAIDELGIKARVLVVGSADEYGMVSRDELPVREEAPLRPLNPYAVSKVTQDFLGYQYHLSRNMDLVRVRPFNHIGPGQRIGFVVPDFASQIARIEAGQAEPVLRVGNLSARRDFTDVRDMARAYRLALEHGRPGCVYNIGSGCSYAIGEILDTLLALSEAKVRVEQDPARARPSDVPELVCDASLFRRTTGWEPRFTLEETLHDVLQEWRDRVRHSAQEERE